MQLLERPWEDLPPGIAVKLRHLRPAIVDDVVATVEAHVPEYGQAGWDSKTVQEALDRVRVVVGRALSEFADLIDQQDARTRDQQELYRAIGRATHARGFGIDVMNRVARVTARVASQWIQRIGTDLELPTEVVLRATEALYFYIDEGSMHTTLGYNQATAAAAGERQARRSELLDTLLLPTPIPAGTMRQAADAAGWQLPTTLAAVALRSEEPVTALAGAIGPDVLAGSSAPSPCLLIPDPDGPGRAELVVRALTGRTAAIGPTVVPADAHRSLALARRTLALTAADIIDAEKFPPHADDHLADLLLSGDTALVEALIERHLAPLDDLTAAARERLCETLLAWLENNCSAPAAGRALHAHAGTVRYRLAQLRELLGDALDQPTSRFELQLALRARRLTPAV
jgi:DNA-binding PucR family transcriptional regulator